MLFAKLQKQQWHMRRGERLRCTARNGETMAYSCMPGSTGSPEPAPRPVPAAPVPKACPQALCTELCAYSSTVLRYSGQPAREPLASASQHPTYVPRVQHGSRARVQPNAPRLCSCTPVCRAPAATAIPGRPHNKPATCLHALHPTSGPASGFDAAQLVLYLEHAGLQRWMHIAHEE